MDERDAKTRQRSSIDGYLWNISWPSIPAAAHCTARSTLCHSISSSWRVHRRRFEIKNRCAKEWAHSHMVAERWSVFTVPASESPSSDNPAESPCNPAESPCSRVASQSTAALIQPIEPPRSRPAGEPPRSVDTALRLGAQSRRFATAASRSVQRSQRSSWSPSQPSQCSSWSPRQHGQPSNMSEEKISWDRIPAWDGDTRQWKRYLRDLELYLETEKLDVDFSHEAPLLSLLAGFAKKYAETIELDQIRRSTGADKATREGMIAGV